jgi:hypothetical protein
MSWKPYMKEVIDEFNESFLLEREYPELYTILKRSESFGQFFDSVEQYLGRVIKELGEDLDWTTEDGFDGLLNAIDEAFALYLEDEENKDVD